MQLNYRASVFVLLILMLSSCSTANQSSNNPSSSQGGGGSFAAPTTSSRSSQNQNQYNAQIGVRTKTSGCVARNALPDSACTPGAIINGATRNAICVPGYSRSVRNVPTSLKDQVYASYGIASHTPGQYEVDHLISLELGGSNDIANLWPELAEPKPGFHEKDLVENYLHDQVCTGAIPLAVAQREIAQNWLDVYSQMQGQSSGAYSNQSSGTSSNQSSSTYSNQSSGATPNQSSSSSSNAPPTLSGGNVARGEGSVPPDGSECPDDYPIKGNIRSDGTRIYHTPDDPNYNRTNPEQCFATTADAQANGFRAPKN